VFGLIRSILIVVVFSVFVYCGATVKLGKRTFFGHVANIWSADETQDLVDGVKETGGPAVERVKRGVKAGVEEAQRDADAGV
jgi:hypothetical protein